MKNNNFVARGRFQCTAHELFAWHEREGAFARLSPPWVDVRLIERSGGIADSSRVVLLLQKGPLRMPWVLGHKDYVAGRSFVDYQIAGPFDFWRHSHECEDDGPTHSYLTDRLEYRMPMGIAGNLFGRPIVHHELTRLFAYRHSLMARDISRLRKYGGKRLKVLLTGSTGLIGSQLKALLQTQGHRVFSLLRRQTTPAVVAGTDVDSIYWDPEVGTIEAPLPEDLDAVINLSGRNVTSSRWTLEEKQLLYESRIKTTNYLVRLISALKHPPQVFISASSIGIYGDRASEPLTEDSSVGAGFAAEICHDWEEAALAVRSAGVRVVLARFGAVLNPRGGALAKLLPVFSSGAGGILGSGEQYFSWVSLDDSIGAIYHALVCPDVEGPLNIVSPNCLTNIELTRTLGRVLKRPTLIPAPAGALRFSLGEMAVLLLSSSRVLPQKLKQTSFEFFDADLAPALKFMFGAAT